MGVVQEMCARIGLTTGVGLSNIKKDIFQRKFYIFVRTSSFANVFNIGADLGAMAKRYATYFSSNKFYFLVIGFAVFSLISRFLFHIKILKVF